MKHEPPRNDKTTTSKAEFARLLGCSRGSVTRLCQRGMPTIGGRIEPLGALTWLVRLTSGHGGGWGGGLRGSDLAQRAEVVLAKRAPEAPSTEAPATSETAIARRAQRELLDRLIVASGRIPEMALKLGLELPEALAAAETFRSLVIALAGDISDNAYDWDREDIPHVVTDTAALMDQFNIKDYPPGFELEAEALCERVDAVVWDTGAGPDSQASAGGAAPEPENRPAKVSQKRGASKASARQRQ